jgi:hypothetical protein
MDQNEIDHLLNEKAVGDTIFKHGLKKIGAYVFWSVSFILLGGIFLLGLESLTLLIQSDLVCLTGLGLI